MRDEYSGTSCPSASAFMLQLLVWAALAGLQDRRLLVTIHESGMLRLWDLPSRRWVPSCMHACQCPMHAPPMPFQCLAATHLQARREQLQPLLCCGFQLCVSNPLLLRPPAPNRLVHAADLLTTPLQGRLVPKLARLTGVRSCARTVVSYV